MNADDPTQWENLHPNGSMHRVHHDGRVFSEAKVTMDDDGNWTASLERTQAGRPHARTGQPTKATILYFQQSEPANRDYAIAWAEEKWSLHNLP